MPTTFSLPEGGPRSIPVVVIEDAAKAPDLAGALMAGGIRTIEVTLRSQAALEAISAIRQAEPEMFVGAGTILAPEDIGYAADAGAQFLVSPGATQALLEAGALSGLPYLPGVATPSEAMALAELGFDKLKFFPADAYGGVTALKGMNGPLPQIGFCPTGGVGAANAAAFLELPNVFAVGGSWLAPKDAVASGDWNKITRIAKQAAALG